MTIQPSAGAMGMAARCWCEPSSETCVMQPEVATVFAARVDGYVNLIEAAWGIIANAQGEHPWDQDSEWRRAAIKWRERYHAMLGNNLEPVIP